MITAMLGVIGAGALVAAWIYFDVFWLLEVPPKKDKKFKDKKVRKVVWN